MLDRTALSPEVLSHSAGVRSPLPEGSDAIRYGKPIRQCRTGCPSWTSLTPRDDKARQAALTLRGSETWCKVRMHRRDAVSRENVMRQAAALTDYQPSVPCPGIKIQHGPGDYRRSSKCD